MDPDIVWVGGIDLFRSEDGGQSWGLASHWWQRPDSRFVHADQHAIVFHPGYDGGSNRILYVGNDGGIFRTNNARATTDRGANAACGPAANDFVWQALNNNYAVTQFYHGAPTPDGTAYFGGTQDNGTLGGDDQSGMTWRRVIGADGGFVAIDYDLPRFVYAETQRRGFRKSNDGGSTFSSAVDGITDDTDAFLFITPYAMDPNSPKRLWLGGERMWRTKNRAKRWQVASTRFPAGSKVSAVAIAPGSSNTILAGTDIGNIHRTTTGLNANAQTNWPRAAPRSGYVTSLAFEPGSSQVAYATYAGFGGAHVWKSTDGGRSWISIDGNGGGKLPDLPVHSLVVDPGDPARLYVGTDLGVFVTTNGGRTWRVENTGFANVITESLSVVTPPGGPPMLFAFTHGRGAFRVPLARSGNPPPPPPPGGADCPLEPGHGRFCDECGPCEAGEGDCDRDSDCAAGLSCGDNLGGQFGFSPNIDVCVATAGGCSENLGSGRYCTTCGPCGEGEGDCDGDAECAQGLVCVNNTGSDFGFNPGVDVCQTPGS